VELWKNPEFIRDYANVIKTKPIFVTGEEAQDIVAALAKVKPEIKAFLLDYSKPRQMTVTVWRKTPPIRQKASSRTLRHHTTSLLDSRQDARESAFILRRNRLMHDVIDIEVTPLSSACGAEIKGVDLTRELSESAVRAIKAAWAKHLVLVFRGQSITQE